MARLVHESAAVELPGAAPRRAVVVGLRTRPKDVHVDHVDAAKALFFDRALHELERRVAAVLLDDEEKDPGPVAGRDHVFPILPSGGHRLLGHDMASGLGTEN